MTSEGKIRPITKRILSCERAYTVNVKPQFSYPSIENDVHFHLLGVDNDSVTTFSNLYGSTRCSNK